MPLGGFSQNWSAPQQSREKEIVEVEKIVEKRVIDIEVEKRLEENLKIEIQLIEKLQKEIRACNDLLDDLIFSK